MYENFKEYLRGWGESQEGLQTVKEKVYITNVLYNLSEGNGVKDDGLNNFGNE